MPFRNGYKYTEGEDTLVLDGTEQTLYEETNEKRVVEVYVDLSQMQAGDSITVKQYMIPKDGGTYIEYGSETYDDAQTIQLLYITPKPTKHGLKVTIQQTVGPFRTIDYQYFVENRR